MVEEKRYFEFRDGKNSKFWEMSYDGKGYGYLPREEPAEARMRKVKKKTSTRKPTKRKTTRKKASKKKGEEEVTFTGVHVSAAKQVHDYLAEQDTEHAIVFSLVDNTWNPRLIENSIRGVQVVVKPEPKLLVMGFDGAAAEK